MKGVRKMDVNINIIDLCNKLGNPTFFQYHHGLILKFKPDLVQAGQWGDIKMELEGQTLATIHLGYVKFSEPILGRPDMLLGKLSKCIKLEQVDTGKVLGWLCWK